ncbi:MAG: hypothetical protein EXS14_04580 [Planctomycetes bacterium]|nr:hypothetical protein [Planctomycetota bacterium]
MKSKHSRPARFHEAMLIVDVLAAHPGAQVLLNAHALPCERCVVSESETLAQGLKAYGLDVSAVLAELNALPE